MLWPQRCVTISRLAANYNLPRNNLPYNRRHFDINPTSATEGSGTPDKKGPPLEATLLAVQSWESDEQNSEAQDNVLPPDLGQKTIAHDASGHKRLALFWHRLHMHRNRAMTPMDLL